MKCLARAPPQESQLSPGTYSPHVAGTFEAGLVRREFEAGLVLGEPMSIVAGRGDGSFG
jgi:hypothetical protein